VVLAHLRQDNVDAADPSATPMSQSARPTKEPLSVALPALERVNGVVVGDQTAVYFESVSTGSLLH
jgi:hypothetical protein